MLINRKKLVNILSGMQLNAGKIDFSVSNQVNFKDNTIFHYNNDIMIYNKLFETTDNFSLSLNDLTNILSKLKDDEIDLSVEDLIKIKSKKTEIELTKQELKFNFEFNKTFNWIDLPDNFSEGISFVSKIVNENNQRFNPIIFIDNNKIVGTDGKCLIIYNLGIDFNKFFLNIKHINLLLKFEVEKFCIENNLIYFLAKDNTVIYFNYLTEQKFPSYEKIQIENGYEFSFLDKLSLSDIEVNLSILDENKSLIIEIEKNKINIKTDNGIIKIKTEIEKENDTEIKFRINADYLLYFLKSNFGESFKTLISESMIKFENEKIIFVTMLIEG